MRCGIPHSPHYLSKPVPTLPPMRTMRLPKMASCKWILDLAGLAVAIITCHGCAEHVTAPPLESSNGPPLPADSIWYTDEGACPVDGMKLGNMCLVCDVSSGPEKCEEKCAGGDGAACALLGSFWEGGHQLWGAADRVKAVSFYQKGCSLGSADACLNLSERMMSGQGVLKDETAGYALLERLCAARSSNACRFEAIACFKGQGTSRSPERGIELVRRACDLGDRISCRIARDPALLTDVDESVRRASQCELTRWGRVSPTPEETCDPPTAKVR